MKIQDFKSGSREGKARVSATVVWEDADRPPLEVYYETTQEAAQGLRCNPNAFLVAAFLPAWRHGERRLHIDGEVCPELRQGLETAMQIIGHWYPRGLSPVRIEAATLARLDPATAPRAGFFFTGGIDSLAVLRTNHQAFPRNHAGRIQDGFLVFGLEVDRLESFEHAVAALDHIAREAEINLLPVFTNVRYLDDDWGFWHDEFQSAVLASIAHAFAGRLTVVSIGSSDDVANLQPYGTHPLLDPCYTSFDLRIRHDGIRMSRLSKTRLVAEWDVALQNLRVCNDSARSRPGQINCGECEKCVRTMLALEAIGALERTHAFSSHPLTSDLVRRAVIMQENMFHFYTELLAPLCDRGRNDLTIALEEAYQRMRGEIGWKAPIKRFDRRYFSGHLVRGMKQIMRRAKSTLPWAPPPRKFLLMENLRLGSGAVASSFISKGSLVYSFSKAKPGQKTYLSVQISETEQIDDPFLWKLNHSCAPTLILDTTKMAAYAARDIQPGALLTFFYPSTEWEMAEPFQCQCGSTHCLGVVQGAKFLSLDTLQRYPMNKHIRRLKEQETPQ